MPHHDNPYRTPTVLVRGLVPEQHAATILGISVGWLQRERWAGTGPAYVRHRRAIRYRLEDLQTWIDKHRQAGEAQ